MITFALALRLKNSDTSYQQGGLPKEFSTGNGLCSSLVLLFYWPGSEGEDNRHLFHSSPVASKKWY